MTTEVPPEALLAEPGMLRRIERFALAYGVLGGLAFLAAGEWSGAAILTLMAVASIVAFRGLEGMVSRLHAQRQGRIGWRTGAKILLRYVFVGGAVAAALFLGSGNFLALIAGLTALPAALMTEGAWQALKALLHRDENG